MALHTWDDKTALLGGDIEGKQQSSYPPHPPTYEQRARERKSQLRPGRVIAGVLLCVAAVFTLGSLERSLLPSYFAPLLEYSADAEKYGPGFDWLKVGLLFKRSLLLGRSQVLGRLKLTVSHLRQHIDQTQRRLRLSSML